MNKARTCIICGKAFQTSSPEVVICSDCGGLPAVPPPAKDKEDVKPAQAPIQAAISTWQLGQVILDTYEVKGELGKGGFGRVYRVHHKTWIMDLAVKRPRAEKPSSQKEVQDFIKERRPGWTRDCIPP